MTPLLTSQRTPGERRAETAGPTGLPTPPSAVRVIRLLAGAALRRWLNRICVSGSLFWRKKPAEAPAGRRKATPGKERTLVWNTLVVGLIGVCVAAFCGFGFVMREGEHLSQRTRDASAAAASDPASSDKDVKEPVANEAAGAPDDSEAIFQSGALWPPPPSDRLLALALGMALAVLSLCQLTTVLDYGGQDLGKVGWDMEWLFTMPAPAWVLFLGRVVQYATAGQMVWWCLLAPFLAVIYWCAGYGWWAVPVALAAMGFGALLTASLGLVVEIVVQKRLTPGRRKNLQAVLGLIGGWSFLAFFTLPGSQMFDSLVVAADAWAPAAVWVNPLSLPALLCMKGWALLGAAAVMVALGVALPLGAVRLAGWMVRDGLVVTPGADRASRRPRGAAFAKVSGMFQGVVGKDLRLLMRDRAFLVRTLVLPVLVFGFFFFQSWHDGISGLKNASIAPALAFCLGGLVLGSSAFQVLTAEGGALWLLYAFPRKLESILLQKTFLWCGLASLYVLAFLAISALAGMPLGGEALIAGVYALVGILIQSFIAAALGILAAHPTEAEVQRRPRTDLVWLHRLLWFFYFVGFMVPLWDKVVLVVLYAPMAYAFWQKVQDRIPYLLEPAAAPAPRISLADGMVAALAFFVLQAVLYFIVSVYCGLDTPHPLPDGTMILIAETIDGVVVTMVTLFFLRRVPNLLARIGLVPSKDEPRPTFLGTAAPGAAAGVLAGIFGVAYMAVILWSGAFPAFKDRQHDWLPDLGLFTFMVLAAPIFEEFLFRGLIYQGMRRSIGPTFAILASAIIFAAIHPSVAVLPVFVLGVAAAVVFQRSRRLWTPILTHVIYNAIVVLAQAAMVRWMM